MTMENAVAAAARSAAAQPAAGRDACTSRPALKPLALPTEHGGWGFLFEPLVLGLAVAPSWGGALIAVAAVFAFLARQPLKFAAQDALRGRSYPRTRWCRLFAVAYLGGAGMAIAGAIALNGWKLTIPFAAVAPLAFVTLIFDARNQSRSLLPEICGSIAMSSTAAAIPLAGGKSLVAAFAVMALLIARGLPAILYVRTLLRRGHGLVASPIPAIASHAVAVAVAYVIASYIAAATAVALLIRAAWGLTKPVPPAKTLGWREMAWGTVSVIAFAFALRIHGGM